MAFEDVLFSKFTYDPEKGTIHNLSGKQVGSYTRKYARLCVYGQHISLSRLAWLLSTGEWPAGEIDHINGNTHDNRLINLRDCTRTQNIWNQDKRVNNKTGFKGVWSEGYKGKIRFRAKAFCNGRTHYLGQFQSAEEAAKAYDSFVQNVHGDYASLNFK